MEADLPRESAGEYRGNLDKREALHIALRHPASWGMSNRRIAAHCGVSEKMVRTYRAQLEATHQVPPQTHRVGRDGRTLNTTNIGSSTDDPTAG